MVRYDSAAARTAHAAETAAYRARRRRDRGLVAHNRFKDPDVRAIWSPNLRTALLRHGPEFGGEFSEQAAMKVLDVVPKAFLRRPVPGKTDGPAHGGFLRSDGLEP
jgi:hypothetical protein